MLHSSARHKVAFMTKLVTEFVKIAQSGPTVDGRNIESSWLHEAAETYDPKIYTALIWPEHLRPYNVGKVVEVKVEEKDGITSLYAKLQPGKYLLSYNESEQKLFTSIEITDDFAESGKVYLTGLGVTDSPASLGTDELRFSHRRQFSGSEIYCSGVELPKEFKNKDPEEVPGWFKKFLSGWSSSHQEENKEPETPEEDSEEMNAEQFKQLTSSIDGLASQFSAMAEAMSKEPEGKGQPEPEPEAPESDKNFSDLSGKVEALTATVKEFTSRLEAANPGTTVPETSGAAGEGGII